MMKDYEGDSPPVRPAGSTVGRCLELESVELQQTRILLVDDHPLVRRALRDILEREPDLHVIGEAGDGRQAIDMTEEHRPDIVIMDISMPVLNGVEATKQIKASNPLISVLILTVHTDVETIFSILQAGASGYLVKSIFGPEVIHTIRAVMDGDMVLSAEVSQEVVKYAFQHGTKSVRPVPQEKLSAKGMEVLTLAAKGLSNKEIGAQLGITEATVKSYFVDVFQKLNVRSRTEAIFVSLKSGILTLDDLG
jgi:two-component system, NarL family, response regulator LiaR